MSTEVKCGNCKLVLDEKSDIQPDKRTPCPSCGSTSRAFAVVMHSAVGISTSFGVKAKHENKKKPFYEEKSGSDPCKKSRKLMKKIRVIDRENNKYKEIVEDPKTGEIIHKCEEPLSNHFGHGDAKKKN